MESLISKADIIIENTIEKINNELINLYWSIGKIVNDYQSENKTNYGSSVINMFCDKLYEKYGKNFNKRNIYHAIKFYETFPVLNTCSKFNNLSWSHIREIII